MRELIPLVFLIFAVVWIWYLINIHSSEIEQVYQQFETTYSYLKPGKVYCIGKHEFMFHEPNNLSSSKTPEAMVINSQGKKVSIEAKYLQECK